MLREILRFMVDETQDLDFSPTYVFLRLNGYPDDTKLSQAERKSLETYSSDIGIGDDEVDLGVLREFFASCDSAQGSLNEAQ